METMFVSCGQRLSPSSAQNIHRVLRVLLKPKQTHPVTNDRNSEGNGITNKSQDNVMCTTSYNTRTRMTVIANVTVMNDVIRKSQVSCLVIHNGDCFVYWFFLFSVTLLSTRWNMNGQKNWTNMPCIFNYEEWQAQQSAETGMQRKHSHSSLWMKKKSNRARNTIGYLPSNCSRIATSK